MNKLLMILTTLIFLSNAAYSQSIESKIREFAKSEYPNDIDMQNYIYKQQMSAYRYMQTVTDNEVKQIAYREYPNDYSMRKYIYDNQLSAKSYMKSVTNAAAKAKAQRECPNDYSMQKYIYDKIVC